MIDEINLLRQKATSKLCLIFWVGLPFFEPATSEVLMVFVMHNKVGDVAFSKCTVIENT